MKKLWYVCMLLTVCLVGCNKTDDLWDDVNDLKTRVTALEKTLKPYANFAKKALPLLILN